MSTKTITGISWNDNREDKKARNIYCICDFETTGVDVDNDFPIEIGCVFTNEEFEVLSIFHSLIQIKELMHLPDWKDKRAYEVHKIPFSYMMAAVDRITVVESLNNLITQIKPKNGGKVIILSDNAQFEYNFMKKLWKNSSYRWPFHYCAWDSSLFLTMLGLEDPKPIHRALPDAFLLHRQLIRAFDRVKNKLKS